MVFDAGHARTTMGALRLPKLDGAGAGPMKEGKTPRPPARLSWRPASEADVGLLSEWNHQLIRDEGHRNPMTVPELAQRMRGWLAGEYEAVIFSEEAPCAYALFRRGPGHVHLRQLFVRRDRRRLGVGRAAFGILRGEVWPRTARLTVDALCANKSAIAFWRSVGYRDYCLTLEIAPP